jgi:protoheme IX farnesyltransferase
MSSVSSVTPVRSAGVIARLRDYVELTKPRIAVLVLISVAAGGFVARWGQPDPIALFHALVGTLLVAASASAMNHYWERGIDMRMRRTRNRPLPAGRLSEQEVLLFAAATVFAGVVYLAITLGALPLLFAIATWVIYVLVYTPMKSRSHWNTHVGAIAGALPVLIGASAAGGTWQPAAALFCIVLLWQFPHFMAIAWIYREDYAAAGMKMSPVVDPTGRHAGMQAVVCALMLLPLSFLAATGHYPLFDASVFMLAALVLGAGQLACAIAFCLHTNDTTARLLLRASLVYLPSLLILLIALPLF